MAATTVLGIRLTAEERDRINAAASVAGMSSAAWARLAVLAEEAATTSTIIQIPNAEPQPPPRRPDTENGKATRSVRRQGAVAGKGKPPTKPPPPARGSVDLHRDEVTMFPKKPK